MMMITIFLMECNSISQSGTEQGVYSLPEFDPCERPKIENVGLNMIEKSYNKRNQVILTDLRVQNTGTTHI